MAATEWSERTRLIITVAAVAVANLGVWGLSYKVKGQLEVKKAALNKLLGEIKELEVIKNSKREKEDEKKNLETENAARRAQLPDEGKRDRFMILLAELQKNYNLADKGAGDPRFDQPVDVMGLANPQNFARDIWPIRCQGDFKGLLEFLSKVEENLDERFVAIENLSITAPNSGMVVTGSKHDISLDLMSYRYAAKSE